MIGFTTLHGKHIAIFLQVRFFQQDGYILPGRSIRDPHPLRGSLENPQVRFRFQYKVLAAP